MSKHSHGGIALDGHDMCRSARWCSLIKDDLREEMLHERPYKGHPYTSTPWNFSATFGYHLVVL